jgi:acyl carrier protein
VPGVSTFYLSRQDFCMTQTQTPTPLELVKSVVHEMSSELGYDTLRKPSPDTALFGGTEGIDSLSLVRIVAEIERAAEDQFAKRVVLADERAMSRRNSPFRTVGSLAELLQERLTE